MSHGMLLNRVARWLERQVWGFGVLDIWTGIHFEAATENRSDSRTQRLCLELSMHFESLLLYQLGRLKFCHNVAHRCQIRASFAGPVGVQVLRQGAGYCDGRQPLLLSPYPYKLP